MTRTLRLFVAVDVPEGHRRAVADAVAPWRERLPGARWTEVAGQHVTLQFLGAVEEERKEAVAEALAAAAGGCETGDVRLSGFGAFPSRKRMRVLWVGLDDPGAVLRRLAASVGDHLARLGFEPEARPFLAHLTLARCRTPLPFPEGLPEDAVAALPPFRIAEVVLYRSHLSPRGARYEPLRSLPLGRGG